MEKMKVLIASCALLLFFIVLFINITLPFHEEHVIAHVKVDKYVGINMDIDKLYFGTVSPGNFGKRSLDIASSEDAVVVISIVGPAAQWITPERNILLITNETSLAFTARVPPETPFGNYTAIITATFYKPISHGFVEQVRTALMF